MVSANWNACGILRRGGFRSRMRSGKSIGRSLESKTVFFALELVLVMFGVGPCAEVLQPSLSDGFRMTNFSILLGWRVMGKEF